MTRLNWEGANRRDRIRRSGSVSITRRRPDDWRTQKPTIGQIEALRRRRLDPDDYPTRGKAQDALTTKHPKPTEEKPQDQQKPPRQKPSPRRDPLEAREGEGIVSHFRTRDLMRGELRYQAVYLAELGMTDEQIARFLTRIHPWSQPYKPARIRVLRDEATEARPWARAYVRALDYLIRETEATFPPSEKLDRFLARMKEDYEAACAASISAHRERTRLRRNAKARERRKRKKRK